MRNGTAERPPWFEWGVATRALPGQGECGDRHLIQPLPNGLLVAVVDGLGHGEDAALAANTAIATLEAHADRSIIELVRCCHEALLKTRGVVMGLASFQATDETITWLGVGNIEGVLLPNSDKPARAREAMPLRGGVVGYQLPALRATVVPIATGDLLLFATDGIRSGFADRVAVNAPAQQIADHILTCFGKDTDDALVLVARYLGREP